MRRRNKTTDGGVAAPAKAENVPGELAPGTVLGKYRVVERLGTGGMGSVYRAVHTGIAKAVALKTMSPQLAADPRTAARFMREAASASRLDHPHVVGVTDFGTDLGISYLVMELLRGEDLGMLIARTPGGLSPVVVADVLLAVCAGVYAAHESGVVHRDLKPPNIFMAQTSLGETVPKVLDFGISKIIEEDGKSPLTNTGMVMGTTHYLSPEQVAGKSADVRSDQYALGVIMYEALVGQRPFEGASAYEIMHAIAEGKCAPARQRRPDLSTALEAVVMRAMSLQAADRFESVHGLGRALLPLASPKRRVMWADYYNRGVNDTADGAPSGRRSGGEETIALEVRPAQLSTTRTQFLQESVAAANQAAPAVPTTSGMMEFPDSLNTDDFRALGFGARRRRRLPLVVMGGVAVLAAALLWRSPALRAQLPAAVRSTLDWARRPAGAVEPSPIPTSPKAQAPTAQPATVQPATVISPLGTSEPTSSWPFEPPSAEDRAAAAAAAPVANDTDGEPGAAKRAGNEVPGDVGQDGQRAGGVQVVQERAADPSAGDEAPPTVARSATARPNPANPDRALPEVYPRPRKRPGARAYEGLPPVSFPSAPPVAPAYQQPPSQPEAPPTTPPPVAPSAPVLQAPEQIPARRYYRPGTAPILD